MLGSLGRLNGRVFTTKHHSTGYNKLWNPTLDSNLGDLWNALNLVDGPIASWSSEKTPGTTLNQSTSDNQPIKEDNYIQFDGSNDSMSRTRHTGILLQRKELPDGAGATVGTGFTCTGLSKAPDGTWWIANDGRSINDDLTYEPSLIHLNSDFNVKLDEILLSDLYPGIESVQGITYDTSDDTIWFSDLSNDAIRHISLDGTVLNDEISFSNPNGLAYDSTRDMLYVGTTSGLSRIDKSGNVDATYNAGASTWDQLWYDPLLDLVWVSWGTNGIDGGLVVVDLEEDRIVAEYNLPGFDAAEGIHIDGNILTCLNDGYFHGTSSGRNEVLIYELQPSTSNIIDIFGLFSIEGTTTTDAIIVAGNPIGGPGWGLFAASTAELRIFANTAAGTSERIQINCAVASLTSLQLVYARINTDNKDVTIWRNGVERVTTGSTAAIDGYLAGQTILTVGNAPDTNARQPTMKLCCLGYYVGGGNRIKTQAWMAHTFGLTSLLPNDDPYKNSPPTES